MEPVELFVTETWLRQNCNLTHGSVLHLPEEAKLTPAAQGFLSDRRIEVIFGDGDDAVTEHPPSVGEALISEPKTVNEPAADFKALKEALKQEILCEIWKDLALTQKPVLTETARTDVEGLGNSSKCEARLRLQAKLESALAQSGLLLAQTRAENDQNEFLLNYVGDVDAALYSVLNADKVNLISDKLVFAGLDEQAIIEIMAKPEQYLGCGHFRCNGSQGVRVAQLEMLRTQIYEVELEARIAYATYDFRMLRQDILSVLNQSVRAVYVLMLFMFSSEQKEKGND